MYTVEEKREIVAIANQFPREYREKVMRIGMPNTYEETMVFIAESIAEKERIQKRVRSAFRSLSRRIAR
jgi:hypothetical protein